MEKLSIIIPLWLLMGLSALAQSPQENMDKYWSYRARFLGTTGTAGFIDIGIGPGKSLPMEARNPFASCQKDYFVTHSECQTRDGKGLVNWVDATVHLGYYIAMLATECYNLKRSNQPQILKATKQELYYALKAVERLDTMAEIACGVPPILDGFFIRDDVSTDFNQSNDQLRFGLCLWR